MDFLELKRQQTLHFQVQCHCLKAKTQKESNIYCLHTKIWVTQHLIETNLEQNYLLIYLLIVNRRILTFASCQIYLDWRDNSSSYWFPSADNHIDYSFAAQHCFDHLLPIFIGQVHVINF